MTAVTTQRGVFAQWRSRLFGDVDPVEAQLADIAKQGAGPARMAHLCATALIVLFSAASFVALGSDTFTVIQQQWIHQHSINVPDTISLSVITLMVFCFDIGLVYAASMLRNLATRRAGFDEKWVHYLVMFGVALAEGSTYLYMAVRYEQPHDGIAMALIILRAVAAPLLAVYLSMARQLPITARDIMAFAELSSGIGVLKDVTIEANNADAPLADKLELFEASAVMQEADRTRLNAMIGVAQKRIAHRAASAASESQAARLRAGEPGGETDDGATDTSTVRFDSQRVLGASSEAPSRPPTGGGSPTAARGTNRRRAEAAEATGTRGGSLSLVAPQEWSDVEREEARNSAVSQGVRTPRKSGKKPRRLNTASVEKKARAYWQPGMSVSQLQIAAGISRSMAGKYKKVFEAEAENAAGEVPEAVAL